MPLYAENAVWPLGPEVDSWQTGARRDRSAELTGSTPGFTVGCGSPKPLGAEEDIAVPGPPHLPIPRLRMPILPLGPEAWRALELWVPVVIDAPSVRGVFQEEQSNNAEALHLFSRPWRVWRWSRPAHTVCALLSAQVFPTGAEGLPQPVCRPVHPAYTWLR